jgi:hypothetical protein
MGAHGNWKLAGRWRGIREIQDAGLRFSKATAASAEVPYFGVFKSPRPPSFLPPCPPRSDSPPPPPPGSFSPK